MLVYLVNPVFASGQNDGFLYGTSYIAACLLRAQHDVKTFVLRNQQDVENFLSSVSRNAPRLVGFSVTTNQSEKITRILERIREQSKAVCIIAGGIHPTLFVPYLLRNPSLSAIVRGEGEGAIIDIAEKMEKNAEIGDIQNVCVRVNGGVKQNTIRPLIDDLDSLPFPDKSTLDYQAVVDYCGGAARFIFSRGCPFKCSYCSNHAIAALYGGSNYLRFRSPALAIEEIDRTCSAYRNINHLILDDDIININKKWFLEFTSQYARHIRKPFICNTRAGTATAETFHLLKQAGCARVNIAIETGNEQLRRTVLVKPISNVQIESTFAMAHAAGLSTMAFNMVGIPGETTDLFMETVRLNKKVKPQVPQLSIFSPYPGTVLGDECIKKNYVLGPKDGADRENAWIDLPEFPAKQIELCFHAFHFLLRLPSWMLLPPMPRISLWIARMWRYGKMLAGKAGLAITAPQK